MSAHLLLVTIGPVQDFIAQARRTRDLWFGSHLLSELARAGARALAEAGGELILPALDRGDRELEPCEGFLRSEGTPPAPIANKLLAELPEGVDPEAKAQAVRKAILAHWKEVADEVRGRCRSLLGEGVDPAWDEQIGTAIEFYAAWAPLDGAYRDVRAKLERALASRKLLREFAPWQHDRPGAPKSSLDGGRVSVLAEDRPKNLVKKYRLGEGEQLDAVGLVKRAGGEPEQFVPIANVALAPWIAEAREIASDDLAAIGNFAKQHDFSRINRPDLGWTQYFPFDANLLLESRLPSLFDEVGIADEPRDFARRHLRPLYAKLGEPCPYVACLTADGDRMGGTLDRLSDPDRHRAFSRELAAFAAEVRGIVEQEHRGSLVYAGGDDALAFLPLSTALACAEALRTCFGKAMKQALPGGAARPTLSVGIGIGHVMEGMGDLLELGRAAEQFAKQTRNSLALILDKRSGGRREWSGSWNETPVARLREDSRLVSARLAVKKVHEIGAVLRRLPEPGVVGADDPGFLAVLAGEVRRALARNEPASLTLADVGLALPAEYKAAREAVARWVDRVLIARAFAEAEPRTRRPNEAPDAAAEAA